MDEISTLKKLGLKNTPVRRAILTYLTQQKKPQTVDELLNQITSQGEKFDKVTLYRTVNTLTELNLLHRVDFGDGSARYELSTLPHHHHLICESCGTVEDINTCVPAQKIKQIEKGTHFTIRHHSLDFYGTCANCTQ